MYLKSKLIAREVQFLQDSGAIFRSILQRLLSLLRGTLDTKNNNIFLALNLLFSFKGHMARKRNALERLTAEAKTITVSIVITYFHLIIDVCTYNAEDEAHINTFACVNV